MNTKLDERKNKNIDKSINTYNLTTDEINEKINKIVKTIIKFENRIK